MESILRLVCVNRRISGMSMGGGGVTTNAYRVSSGIEGIG